jgi:uncharacterized protein (DUF1778 family)
MSKLQSFSLRLSHSLKRALQKAAEKDGVSINQFVSTAIAEKLAVLETNEFFSEYQERADFTEFARIMSRANGAPPREGDEISDVE